MASHRPSPPPAAPPKPLDLDIMVLSAKHLKNVNWRHGDLKPYAVAYLDPDRRAATKPDDSGSTKPVWNERLVLPLPPPSHLDDPSYVLTLDVFHSRPSETPKPLVGTARCPLKDLLESDSLKGFVTTESTPIKALELRRPSGRPQGKIRIRLALRERPTRPPEHSYTVAPSSGYYYSTAPPPPPLTARDYGRYSPSPLAFAPYDNSVLPQPSQYSCGVFSDSYPGYYSSAPGCYSAPPEPAPAPIPARPYYDRASGYGGPSAPVDYSSGYSSYYEQKGKGSRLGMGTGLAAGAVAGALGGLALEEGLKYEEEKIAERVENDLVTRDDCSDYRADY